AEAEVEYHDYTSDTVWVKFPCRMVARHGATVDDAKIEWNSLGARRPAADKLEPASIVRWTTTPWTLPGNRAISFSPKISYGVYLVTKAPEGNWAKEGARYVLADKRSSDVLKAAKVEAWDRLQSLSADALAVGDCDHP